MNWVRGPSIERLFSGGPGTGPSLGRVQKTTKGGHFSWYAKTADGPSKHFNSPHDAKRWVELVVRLKGHT